MNHSYQLGDTVMLTLGSPRITVVNIEPDMIYGSYVEDGVKQYGRWHHSAVRLVRAVNTNYDVGEEPEVDDVTDTTVVPDPPAKKRKSSD